MNLKKKLMLGASSLAIACSAYNAQAAMFEGRPASEYLEAGVQKIAPTTHWCVRQAVETAGQYDLSAGCNLIKGYESLSPEGKEALNEYLGAIMGPGFVNQNTDKHAHAVIHESPELASQLRPGHNNVTNLMWGVHGFFQYYAKEAILGRLYGIDHARVLIKAADHAPEGYIPKSPVEEGGDGLKRAYIKDLINEGFKSLSENDRTYIFSLLTNNVRSEIKVRPKILHGYVGEYEGYLAAPGLDQQRQVLFGGE